MGPHQGAYSEKIVFSMAVPLVAVRRALRMPNKPRVGILYVTLHEKPAPDQTCKSTKDLRCKEHVFWCYCLACRELVTE